MRTLLSSVTLLVANASVLLAQEEQAGPGLVSIRVNLMFWTLAIFVVLYVILRRFAFPKIFGAVEAREKALQDAIDAAKRDREESEKLLNEQRRQIEGARDEAQKLIADGRATAEKMRADLLEHTRKEQQDMLDRARRDIDTEKERALAQLRREAVNLAIAGASKVIEENLDSKKNRDLVESYLSSLGSLKVTQ
jgi:F-type H+-transporting ATPase subunit b